MDGLRPDSKDERVWDPLVRLFHWSLVAAFATAWFARGEAWLHEGAGKLVLILVIFRLVWGVIGPGSARFENFIRGPIATARYVWDILRGRPAHYVGHNPAGAAMIVLLLACLAVTTGAGIVMSTTKFWGNGTVEFIHGQAAHLMLWLIGAHVLGVLVASFQHKDNLIFSMITGWKKVAPETQPYLGDVMWSFRRLLLALLIAGGAAAVWQSATLVLNASAWRAEKVIAAAARDAGCTTVEVGGPAFLVHPAFELHYKVISTSKTVTLVVPLSVALQKKAAFDLSPLQDFCKPAVSDASPPITKRPMATGANYFSTLALVVPIKAFRQAVALPKSQFESKQLGTFRAKIETASEPPRPARVEPKQVVALHAKTEAPSVAPSPAPVVRKTPQKPSLLRLSSRVAKVRKAISVRKFKSVRKYRLRKPRQGVERWHRPEGGRHISRDDGDDSSGRGRGRSGRDGGDDGGGRGSGGGGDDD